MKPVSLPAAREAAVAARARHCDDTAALTRSRDRLAGVAAELKRLAADDEAAIFRHAQRLMRQTREGAAGPPPSLVPTDAQMAARLTAQRTHEAARRMVTSLESAERESAVALAAAEESLQSTVLKAVSQDAARMAAELEQARAKVEELEALLDACRELPGIEPHLAVSVHIALRDDLNTPINQIPDRGDFARPAGEVRMRPTPTDATAHWRARIAQLSTEPPSVAA
jgi:hypothetical protein